MIPAQPAITGRGAAGVAGTAAQAVFVRKYGERWYLHVSAASERDWRASCMGGPMSR